MWGAAFWRQTFFWLDVGCSTIPSDYIINGTNASSKYNNITIIFEHFEVLMQTAHIMTVVLMTLRPTDPVKQFLAYNSVNKKVMLS